MSPVVRFEPAESDGRARIGTLHTGHGPVATPAFMPVGTRGTVRTLDGRDLAEAGAQMVLANTYHLMLRPGAEVVAALGGLHGFASWEGAMLTDSGGYQVFSLSPSVDEEGDLRCDPRRCIMHAWAEIHGTSAWGGRGMTRLAIRVLGPFQASLDGRLIGGFHSDKVRALLAYLCVEAKGPHRPCPEHTAARAKSR